MLSFSRVVVCSLSALVKVGAMMGSSHSSVPLGGEGWGQGWETPCVPLHSQGDWGVQGQGMVPCMYPPQSGVQVGSGPVNVVYVPVIVNMNDWQNEMLPFQPQQHPFPMNPLFELQRIGPQMQRTDNQDQSFSLPQQVPPLQPGMQQVPPLQPGMQQVPPLQPGMQQVPPLQPGMQQVPPLQPGMQQVPPLQPGMQQVPPPDSGVFGIESSSADGIALGELESVQSRLSQGLSSFDKAWGSTNGHGGEGKTTTNIGLMSAPLPSSRATFSDIGGQQSSRLRTALSTSEIARTFEEDNTEVGVNPQGGRGALESPEKREHLRGPQGKRKNQPAKRDEVLPAPAGPPPGPSSDAASITSVAAETLALFPKVNPSESSSPDAVCLKEHARKQWAILAAPSSEKIPCSPKIKVLRILKFPFRIRADRNLQRTLQYLASTLVRLPILRVPAPVKAFHVWTSTAKGSPSSLSGSTQAAPSSSSLSGSLTAIPEEAASVEAFVEPSQLVRVEGGPLPRLTPENLLKAKLIMQRVMETAAMAPEGVSRNIGIDMLLPESRRKLSLFQGFISTLHLHIRDISGVLRTQQAEDLAHALHDGFETWEETWKKSLTKEGIVKNPVISTEFSREKHTSDLELLEAISVFLRMTIPERGCGHIRLSVLDPFLPLRPELKPGEGGVEVSDSLYSLLIHKWNGKNILESAVLRDAILESLYFAPAVEGRQRIKVLVEYIQW